MRAPVPERDRTALRQAAFIVLVAAITFTWGGAAKAEGGEFFLRLTFANEAAVLHHPEVTYNSGGPWVYIPRFGAAATYGVAHWLSLGIGGEVSLTQDTSAHNVVTQGLPPGVLAARYLGLMVPVRLGFHVADGGDWSAEIVASGGPALARWSADEVRSSSGVRMPLNALENWYTQWFGRLAVMAEWRPANWGAVAFGPYVGASTTRDFYVGLLIEGALIWELGPFIKE